MEASANLADASMLMRKIGFIVVLLRGLLSAVCFYPSISIKMGMLTKLHRVDRTAPVAAYWSSAP